MSYNPYSAWPIFTYLVALRSNMGISTKKHLFNFLLVNVALARTKWNLKVNLSVISPVRLFWAEKQPRFFLITKIKVLVNSNLDLKYAFVTYTFGYIREE